MREKPTAAEVKAYRDKEHIGILEAKRELFREWYRLCLGDIGSREFSTIEQCGDAIKELVRVLAGNLQ